MLWDRQWKKHLIMLSDTYTKDPNKQNFTVEELAGEGNFHKTNNQAQLLPETVLQDITTAAKTALLLNPFHSKLCHH